MKYPTLLFAMLYWLWALLAAPLAAAGNDDGDTAESPVPSTLASPRASMETFLHAMNDIKRGQPERIADALSTLDLAEVNELVQAEVGRNLAWTLLEVLDRTRIIDTATIPDRRTGADYEFARYPAGDVRIVFVDMRGWLFSRDTLRTLPAVLDGLIAAREPSRKADGEGQDYLPMHLRIRALLGDSLRQQAFILENWQWLSLLLIIFAGLLLDRVTSVVLRGLVRHWRRRTDSPAYQGISGDLLRPLGLMSMAAVWWGGLNTLGLPADVLLILLISVKFLAALSGVWAAYRLVDLIAAYLGSRASATESKLDDALVPMIGKTLKVFVSILGLIFIADNLNINVTSLLAGLGLGGLAFALAAKDVVGNLFGSITVLMDRTFHVGDWVIVGDVEGSVESIGFRSTRIRSFYNSLISVPNSTLITATVDNMGQRRYRRLKCNLAVAYDTPPDRLEAFCEGIRELVRLHPYMRKDYYHVYFNQFGDSGLLVLVYVFWEVPDWGTELRERHRFLLDCLRLARRLGVEYAYPTQTLYLKRAGGGPEEPGPGRLHEPVPQATAFDRGRAEARDIVAETTGLDARPPPVSFR